MRCMGCFKVSSGGWAKSSNPSQVENTIYGSTTTFVAPIEPRTQEKTPPGFANKPSCRQQKVFLGREQFIRETAARTRLQPGSRGEEISNSDWAKRALLPGIPPSQIFFFFAVCYSWILVSSAQRFSSHLPRTRVYRGQTTLTPLQRTRVA